MHFLISIHVHSNNLLRRATHPRLTRSATMIPAITSPPRTPAMMPPEDRGWLFPGTSPEIRIKQIKQN